MTLGEHCDEIIRLIDEALAPEPVGGPNVRVSPSGRWAERPVDSGRHPTRSNVGGAR